MAGIFLISATCGFIMLGSVNMMPPPGFNILENSFNARIHFQMMKGRTADNEVIAVRFEFGFIGIAHDKFDVFGMDTLLRFLDQCIGNVNCHDGVIRRGQFFCKETCAATDFQDELLVADKFLKQPASSGPSYFPRGR